MGFYPEDKSLSVQELIAVLREYPLNATVHWEDGSGPVAISADEIRYFEDDNEVWL